ncbi:MAG: AI-2E family transporter [Actinomycetes bacterium]
MSLINALSRLLSAADAAPRQLEPAPPVVVVAPPPEPSLLPLEPHVPAGLTIAAGYAWRLVALVAAGAVVVVGLQYFSNVTVPVAVAILLAAMLFPIVEKLVSWGWPRLAAALTALLGMLLLIAGLLVFVGTQVVAEWPQLVDQSIDGFESLLRWLNSGPLAIDSTQLGQWFDTARAWLESQATALAATAATVGAAFGTFLAGAATALVAAFFFAYQGRHIFSSGISLLIPAQYRAATDNAAQRGWKSLVAYMRSAVIVAAVDAVGVATFAFFLNVPLVAALLALTFFLSFIPIVGAVTAGAVAVVLALVTQGWVAALIMLGGTIAVMQIEGNFLQPLVMGSAVDVHPLAVLLGITAGAVVAGILGALMAIPVVAFTVAFVKAIRNPTPAPEALPK